MITITVLFKLRIVQLRPTSNVSRLPVKVSNERSFFKASQYSDLLLYYLYYALYELLEFNVVKHFRKLSAAIYILLQSEICEEDLLKSERLLKEFVKEYEEIYGQDAVTMNSHLLVHLPQTVRIAGPLWVYAAFGFEGNLGKQIRTISGTRNFAEQLVFQYCLERKTKAPNVPTENLSNRIENAEPLRVLLNRNEISSNCYEFYAKLRLKDGEHITSEYYHETKRNNRFVRLLDDRYCCIVAFGIKESQNFAVIRICSILHSEDHFTQIKPETKYEIVPVSHIKYKMIHLQFDTREFLTKQYIHNSSTDD